MRRCRGTLQISKKKPSARHCHRRRVMAYRPFVSVFRGLEPRHPLGAVEFRGVGLGEEALEGGDEVAGALEHGDVAGVFEDLEAAAGELGVGLTGMLDRDDWVVLTPEDEERQGFGEVQTVERADPLALHADDRAQGGEKGLATLR